MDLLAQVTTSDHRVENLLDQRHRAPELAADRVAQPRAPADGTDHGAAAQAAEHHLHGIEIDIFAFTGLHPSNTFPANRRASDLREREMEPTRELDGRHSIATDNGPHVSLTHDNVAS